MNLRNVSTIVRKELREMLRDKRTLVAMFGVPILLYPLLIIVMGQVTIVQQTQLEKRTSKVGLLANAPQDLRDWLGDLDKVELVEISDPNEALLDGDVDAAVLPEDGLTAQLDQLRTGRVEIRYDSTDEQSRKAVERIAERLRERSKEILAARLEDAGLEKGFADPLRIRQVNVAPPAKVTGSILGMTLPMIMIIMLGTGAFYPAVDLTAGEKERGTFETLLAAPVGKTDIVTGKFVTVLCLSLITGFLSLASMSASLLFQLNQMTAQLEQTGGQSVLTRFVQISPLTLAIIFLALIPLAFFICSVMMSIAVIARDYKEAQHFVTPFMMLIVLPSMAAVVPGVELNTATILIPIGNVALLFKQLLIGEIDAQNIFLVLLSTAVYAVFALVVAVRLFHREDVILSEEKGLPLSLRRGEFTYHRVPTPGMSLLLFALGLLMMFYLGTYFQTREIISGLFISQWLLLLAPTVLILWYTRTDLRRTLRLYRPSLVAILAAVVLAAGVYILTLQAAHWQRTFMPPPEQYTQQFEQIFEQGKGDIEFWILLAAVAVSPAVCEEVLFRGAIFAGLRDRMRPIAAIVLVSLLFAFMHMSVYSLLHTFLLGLALAYLVERTGSIVPAMLFHFCINGTSTAVSTGRLPESILNLFPADDGGFPVPTLLVAAVVAAAGVALTELSARTAAARRAKELQAESRTDENGNSE